MGTPLAQDQFSRFMVEAFDIRSVFSVSTVFQSFFGRPENGAKTVYSPDKNSVSIDIVKGTEKVGALVHRGSISGANIGRKKTVTQKYSNFTRAYPLGEEEGDITADQILERRAGESAEDTRSRLGTMRKYGVEHMQEHVRRFVRMFEVLAGQSLLTGKHDAILGTTDLDMQYDFRRNASNTITVTNAWDSGSQDIMGDIDGACDQARTAGKVTPNVMIMPGDVMDSFIKDTTVQSLADNRRFELIEVSTGFPVPAKFNDLIESGAEPRGRLRTPAGRTLWLFTYIDEYEDADGNATKYMPAGKALIAHYGVRCDRYFGPGEVLPADPAQVQMMQYYFGVNMNSAPSVPNIKNASKIIDPGMFYVDAYKTNNNKVITVRTQTAPIFATTHTDAFVVLDGLST